MNIIILDDNQNFEEALKRGFLPPLDDDGKVKNYPSWTIKLLPPIIPEGNISKDRLVYLLAARLNQLAKKFDEPSEVLILININLNTSNNHLQDCLGVKILKEIRLNTYFNEGNEYSVIWSNSVIMYSFIEPEDLLFLQADNRYIFSPNTAFLKLPEKIDEDLISQLKDRRQSAPEAIKEYLQNELEVNLGDNRHGYANLYGACIMRHIALSLIGSSSLQEESVPSHKLREAMFLYVKRFGDLREQTYADSILKISDKIKDNLGYVKEDGFQSRIALIDDDAMHIKVVDSSLKLQFGWKHIYDQMILREKKPGKEPVVSILDKYFDKKFLRQLQNSTSKNRAIGNLVGKVIEGVQRKEYSCILLDIWLLGSSNFRDKIEDSIGALLLEQLRSRLPTFPVIVTTASNKPWKHRYLYQLGADAVWVKEGVDERRSVEDSLENYKRLLNLIQQASGNKYQFLGRVGAQILHLKKEPNLWWKNQIRFDHKDDSNKTINGVKISGLDEIIINLEHAAMNLRRYLREFHLDVDDDMVFTLSQEQKKMENYLAKSIIRHLSLIIEQIHGKTFNSELRINAGDIGGWQAPKGKDYKIGRGDWIGFALYQHRNECSHNFDHIKYQFGNIGDHGRCLTYFVSHFLAYLSLDEMPYSSHCKIDLTKSKGDSGSEGSLIKPDYLNWLSKDRVKDNDLTADQKRKLKKHYAEFWKIMYGN